MIEKLMVIPGIVLVLVIGHDMSWGQQPVPVVPGPKAVVTSPAGLSVPAGYPVLFDASASIADPDQPLQWQVVRPPGSVILTYDKKGREAIAGLLVTFFGKDETYTVAVSACAVDPQTHRPLVDTAVIDLKAVSSPGPSPPPGPGPNPPPGPGPGPVSGALTRVLMAYESTAGLTAAQYKVLDSTVVRAKLTTVLPKDGLVAAWRCWDVDMDVSRETPGWQTAWSAVKSELTSLPCVVLWTESGHRVVPLPATEADFIALIDSYKGVR